MQGPSMPKATSISMDVAQPSGSRESKEPWWIDVVHHGWRRKLFHDLPQGPFHDGSGGCGRGVGGVGGGGSGGGGGGYILNKKIRLKC